MHILRAKRPDIARIVSDQRHRIALVVPQRVTERWNQRQQSGDDGAHRQRDRPSPGLRVHWAHDAFNDMPLRLCFGLSAH